jgi:hypothetical protein
LKPTARQLHAKVMQESGRGKVETVMIKVETVDQTPKVEHHMVQILFEMTHIFQIETTMITPNLVQLE